MNSSNESRILIDAKIASHEVIPISLPVAIVFAIMSSMIGSVNIVYITVCFRVLRRKFFNLVILALCNSDAVLGFGCMLFAIAPKVQFIRTNLLSCRIQVFTLSFSIVSTYSLLFLLCLQRYMTVRSYNFGTKLYFDRYKYQIIGSTIAFTFTTVFGTIFFLPREYEGNSVASCNPEDVFGYFYFRIFYTIVFTPITLVMLLLFTLSILTAFELYRMFFRQINRVSSAGSIGKKDQSDGNKATDFGIFLAKSDAEKVTFKKSLVQKENEENTTSSMFNIVDGHDKRKSRDISEDMVDLSFLPDDPNIDGGRCETSTANTTQKKTKKGKNYLEDHEGAIGMDNKKLTRKEWELRAFITSLFVALTAIIFTGPFVVSIWFDVLSGIPLPMEKKMLLFLPISLNVFSNPFLYAWRIPEIRNEFKKIYFRLKHGKTNAVGVV